MFNVLTEPMIRATTLGGVRLLTLPGLLAALSRDEVAGLPGVRPHQRHAWHAFLVQLGALSLLATERTEPWADEAGWREGLRALTPEHLDDSPWSLVTPPDRPALLQPPIPGGLQELRGAIASPDALDMLVTSRNHDLKGVVMTRAGADDWLFALVTLQTMEGYDGSTNYGISRMNGAYGSRPALGVAPPGGPGAHMRRDLARLLELRGATPLSAPYARSGGLGLIWLEPWDGTDSLRPERLDEFYIEICRRVRLTQVGGAISARTSGSRTTRVAATGGGLTGDPWAPLVTDGAARKVMSVTAAGFGYRRMVKLIWPEPGNASALQAVTPTDAATGLIVLARALARGQGKTEGYHERRVPLSRHVTRLAAQRATDPSGHAAAQRVALAGEVGRVLRASLMSLFQGGPLTIDQRDKDSQRKAELFLALFDAEIDRTFFEDLLAETDGAEAEVAGDVHPERVRWVGMLLRRARDMLNRADAGAPKASRRRLRARVRAHALLNATPFGNAQLRPYLPERTSDAV